MIERTASSRLLACAVAAVLLAACGSVSALPSPAPVPASPTPRPASPAATPTSTFGPFQTGTTEQAAAFVAATVPADRVRLMPASIPAGMSARVTMTADGYQVDYADDLHTKQITLAGRFGMNPPPPVGGHAVSSYRQFRGVRASYVVYDSTAPTSQRYLLWLEPGTWPRLASGAPSNECFLEPAASPRRSFSRWRTRYGP